MIDQKSLAIEILACIRQHYAGLVDFQRVNRAPQVEMCLVGGKGMAISVVSTIEKNTDKADLCTVSPQTEAECRTLGDHLYLTKKALGLPAQGR